MRVTANQVTTVRLAAMPLLGYLVYCSPQAQVLGVILGTLIGLTDTVDGYLARKYGVTVLGSLLDPVADKVFTVVCYGVCADMGIIPWWVAAAVCPAPTPPRRRPGCRCWALASSCCRRSSASAATWSFCSACRWGLRC